MKSWLKARRFLVCSMYVERCVTGHREGSSTAFREIEGEECPGRYCLSPGPTKKVAFSGCIVMNCGEMSSKVRSAIRLIDARAMRTRVLADSFVGRMSL